MAKTHAGDAPRPQFRDMTRSECEALLARNNVGRMAFSLHDRVDIEPLHYVFADGWLYGRTGSGTKISMLGHNPWVEPLMKDRVDQAHHGDCASAQQKPHAAFAPGFIPEHRCSPKNPAAQYAAQQK